MARASQLVLEPLLRSQRGGRGSEMQVWSSRHLARDLLQEQPEPNKETHRQPGQTYGHVTLQAREWGQPPNWKS